MPALNSLDAIGVAEAWKKREKNRGRKCGKREGDAVSEEEFSLITEQRRKEKEIKEKKNKKETTWHKTRKATKEMQENHNIIL